MNYTPSTLPIFPNLIPWTNLTWQDRWISVTRRTTLPIFLDTYNGLVENRWVHKDFSSWSILIATPTSLYIRIKINSLDFSNKLNFKRKREAAIYEKFTNYIKTFQIQDLQRELTVYCEWRYGEWEHCQSTRRQSSHPWSRNSPKCIAYEWEQHVGRDNGLEARKHSRSRCWIQNH